MQCTQKLFVCICHVDRIRVAAHDH
jgi:hypothetical protein